MPNFDGGHYYLTALVPIRTDILIKDEDLVRSPVQVVRNVLAELPTALQTEATKHIGINSPFSRNTRTHFARFVVIDSLMYNGRDPMNALKVFARGINPVLPQPQDKLSCPFLLFVADFDADNGNEDQLTSYLAALWTTMETELRAVFEHCVDFQRQVQDAGSFAAYIQRCQIETTMPFNDYWTTSPPLKSLRNLIILFPIVFAVSGLALAWHLRGSPPQQGAGAVVIYWAEAIGGAIGGLLAGGVVGLLPAYWIVMWRAKQPLPTAPDSDLPHVLKALYLQQKFTQLAIAAQGMSVDDLYKNFGSFVAALRLDDLQQPKDLQPPTTQSPGVIRS